MNTNLFTRLMHIPFLNPLCAVVVSACVLNTAYFFPTRCSWLVFLFLVPLFYHLFYNKLLCKHGLIWGIVFWMPQLYGITLLFIERAEGPLRLVVPLCLIMYCAAQSFFWFVCAVYAARLVSHKVLKIVVWGVVTWLYFMWIGYGMLWFFGFLVGYPFAVPIILLATHPQWLSLLWLFKPMGLMACLIATQAAGVLACITKQWRWVLVSIVCFIPFGWGWLVPMPESKPDCLNTICYVQPPTVQGLCACDAAHAIDDALEVVLRKHPQVICCLMPESSFAYALNEHPQAVLLWTHNALKDGVQLIIGAHRTTNECNHNTLFCVQLNSITDHYDKNICMPLTEYLPRWCNIPLFRHLFLKNKKEFPPKKKCAVNQLMPLTPHTFVIPRICSELFFDPHFVPISGYPVLCAVNDSWFTAPYLRKLMALFAGSKALEWQTTVLYISHYYGIAAAADGKVTQLLC